MESLLGADIRPGVWVIAVAASGASVVVVVVVVAPMATTSAEAPLGVEELVYYALGLVGDLP